MNSYAKNDTIYNNLHWPVKIKTENKVLTASFLQSPDTIFLKNGMRLDVEKIWEKGGEIKYEMYGSVYSYPKDDVSQINRIDDYLMKKNLVVCKPRGFLF